MFTSKAKINMWANCGDDYYYGRGGEKVDYEMAVHFYEKAEEKQHPYATRMLAMCYELGHGVEADAEMAEILYQKAVLHGDPEAGNHLTEAGTLKPSNPKDYIQTTDGLVYSPKVAKFIASEKENPDFWLQYGTEKKRINRLLQKLSLPVKEKESEFTYKELEGLLRDIRKKDETDNENYAALTVALLMIKAKLGGSALWSGNTVRAYLTDFLPNIKEMRLLSALVYDTAAVDCLRSDPQKAVELLKKKGMSEFEAEQIIDCFVAAFAVRVDYSGLTNEALAAAMEYGDTDAMYHRATRYLDDDGEDEKCRELLQKAADLGHGPAAALLPMMEAFWFE